MQWGACNTGNSDKLFANVIDKVKTPASKLVLCRFCSFAVYLSLSLLRSIISFESYLLVISPPFAIAIVKFWFLERPRKRIVHAISAKHFTSGYQSESLPAVCIPSKLRNFTGRQPVNPQMRSGRLMPPPANMKYVNCYNFWWDCPILKYLVCLDSE